jgi:hypothetical protein
VTSEDAIAGASAGTVWVGLIFLAIKTLQAIVGTRHERTENENWRDLFEHLNKLAAAYERVVDKAIDTLAKRSE